MDKNNGKYESERAKKRKVLAGWTSNLRNMIGQGWKPTILIYGRIENPEHTQVSWHIVHPGMNSAQTTKIMCVCTEAVNRDAQREQLKKGPRLILPGQT